MKNRFFSFSLIALALMMALPQAGGARAAALEPRAASEPIGLLQLQPLAHSDSIISASTFITRNIYLPFVGNPLDCSIPGATYGSFAPGGTDTDPSHPASTNYDKNLVDMRKYTPDASGSLDYTFKSGEGVSTAPRLWSLFYPTQSPGFLHVYNVGKAPWDSGYPGWWPDTMVGIATTVGKQIHLPISPGASSVAQPGGPGTTQYYGLVIYATASQITIVYHAWDRIVDENTKGYGLHVTKVCVDPKLVNFYKQLNDAGRHQLPALTYNQAFGVANSTEVAVAITDSGTLMDPRSWRDWWRP